MYFFSFVSINSFAADRRVQWQAVSDFKNDDERLKFLIDKNIERITGDTKEELKKLAYHFFTNQEMNGFGQSFTYLGKEEQDFLRYLEDLDSKLENGLVVVPGCGYGRTVLDALSKTRHLKFIANDISENATNVLKRAINAWFPEHDQSRVTINHEDVFKMLKNLPDKSVDVFFCANLIHFFAPDKLELFFNELRRTLKDNGKVFVIWQGFDLELNHNFQNEFPYNILLDLVAKIQSLDVKFSSYVDPKVFTHELALVDIKCPYNFISRDELEKLLDFLGFMIVEKNRFTPFVKNISSKAPSMKFSCTYREEAVSDTVQRVYANMFILEKSPEFVAKSIAYSADFSNGNWLIAIKSKYCDQCQRLHKKTMKCSSCKSAKYCSQTCQRAAWTTHRFHCSSLKKD